MERESELNSVFICLKNLLLSDKTLTNYSRYIDFGKIKKITSNGSVMYRWETEPCVLNEQNLHNVTQLIRIIRKIDSRFFYDLNKYLEQVENTDYGNITQKDILFNTRNKVYDNNYRKTVEISQNFILQKMVNIDCKFKIKGTSLTVFDLVGKNLNSCDAENNFYYHIACNASKIILVGDKGYILALIDRQHHVFLSAQILKRIYDLDETVDKSIFNNIMLRLFYTLNTFCCYMLTTTISTYFNNQFSTSIIRDIFNNADFSVNDKMMLYSISNFKFNEDTDTNTLIRSKIENVIYEYVSNYLNRETYIDCLDISTFMKEYEESIKIKNSIYTDNAFRTGLSIGNVMLKLGWKYVTEKGSIKGKYSNYYLENEHIYFVKRLDMIPIKAVVRNSSSGTRFRIIKENKIEEFGNYYGLRVYDLILDITSGIMICDGKHPNVSHSVVCMGDLKGMVTFTGKNENEIRDLINKCEQLLTVINYTSSYTDTGYNAFLDDAMSMPWDSLLASTGNTATQNSNSASEITELESADQFDYSDDNTTEEEEEVIHPNIIDRVDAGSGSDWEVVSDEV